MFPKRIIIAAFSISAAASFLLCGYEFIRAVSNSLFIDAYTAGEYGHPGPFVEGPASLKEYRDLGEVSLYDSDGGEWRPHPPDTHHDAHWDYKVKTMSRGQNVGRWRNIDLSGEDIPKN